MKYQLLFFLLLAISTESLALVPYIATDRECSHRLKIDNFVLSRYIYKNTPQELNVQQTMRDMQLELSLLIENLKNNGDKKLRKKTKVCLGVVDGPNRKSAYANRYYAIGYGAELLSKFKTSYRFGQDVFYIILFHEFAHSIQARYNVDSRSGASKAHQKISEMQADCMSAVFMKMQNRFHSGVSAAYDEFTRRSGARSSNGSYGITSERRRAALYGEKQYDQSTSLSRLNSRHILNQLCPRSEMRNLLEPRKAIY